MIGAEQRVRVLMVEDSSDDLLMLEAALEQGSAPIDLHVVTDGDAATRFLRREGEFADAARPDLILLDLNLPRKDGREVLLEVKLDPDLRRIPIIVLTTSGAERDIVESYQHGANAYITKPFELDELFSAVRKFEDFWIKLARLPPE